MQPLKPISNSFGDAATHVSREPLRANDVAVTAMCRILLAVVLIEIPLQLDTYLHHSLDEAKFGAISGFNVSLSTVCLALLYAIWLPQLAVASRPVRTNLGLVLYLFFVGVSLLWAGDKSRWLYEVFLLTQAFLLFTYIVNHVRTQADVMFVTVFLMIGLLVQGAFMAGSRLVDDDIFVGPVEFKIYSQSHRVSGSLGSPNVASSYISLLIAPCLSLLFTPVSRPIRALALLATALGSVALILTLSRGGWLATAISLLVLFAVATRRRWIRPAVFAVVFVGFAVVSVSFHEVLSRRLLGDDGGSAAARWPLADISAQMIVQHPLGVGANNWDLAARPYAELSGFSAEWFFTVHNKYLLVWSEIGLFGLLAFVAFLVSTIAYGRRAWKSDHPVLAPLALGFTAALIAHVIHMSADIFNSRVQIMMLWVIAALIMAIDLETRRQATRNKTVST